MTETFDIADVRFVKRVVVGNTDPSNMRDESVIQKQMDYLNRCLQENPKGCVIGKEKGFQGLPPSSIDTRMSGNKK